MVITTEYEIIFMTDSYLLSQLRRGNCIQRFLTFKLMLCMWNIFYNLELKSWKVVWFPIISAQSVRVYWEFQPNVELALTSDYWSRVQLHTAALGCSGCHQGESVSQIRADQARSISDRFLCYSALSQPRLQCTVCTHAIPALSLVAREQYAPLIGRPGVNRASDWPTGHDPGSGWIIH